MRTQVVIYATLALNALLFLSNLFVAIISGSRAVFSQAVYSLTDLIGAVFLLWGLVASQKPPTYEHPFGHGKERFFWGFSASLVTFTIAGLLVLTDGLGQVISPVPLDHIGAALAVVGLTLVLSIIGIWVTLRELRRSEQSLAVLLESAHQGLRTIFYQDLVSVFGAVVAFGGIAVVFKTHDPAVDGAAATIVGLLLLATGLVLAAESRELLIGKAISPEHARAMLAIVERSPSVRKVRSFQSMMLGPDDVLVALRVNFQDGLTTDQLESAIDQVTAAVRAEFPTVRHMVIEPES